MTIPHRIVLLLGKKNLHNKNVNFNYFVSLFHTLFLKNEAFIFLSAHLDVKGLECPDYYDDKTETASISYYNCSLG